MPDLLSESIPKRNSLQTIRDYVPARLMKAGSAILPCLCLLFTGSLFPTPAASQQRSIIVVSDAHLGVGKINGKWHPYEDGRWSEEFGRFLKSVDELTGGAGDLVLNGDTFELLQSVENDCIHPDKDESCNEEEALARMRVVLASHKAELASIHDFAVAHDNRVYVVPGNHDVALLFPKVAAEFLKAVQAPGDRVRVLKEGYWLSSDHLIYAEHGQQIGADVNRFRNWPEPFVTSHGERRLQRPWGEQFVQQFFNRLEEKYPVIDNLASETLGVKYGFAAEGIPGTINNFGRFVKFYLTQQSVLQLGQELGPDGGEGWDIDLIRLQGDRFFYESIPDDDPLYEATKRSVADGSLGLSLADLSNDEISGICAVRAERAASETGAAHIKRCPKKDLGAVLQRLVRSRESVYMDHLNATASRLAKAGVHPVFELFIYSHTHAAEAAYTPFQHSDSSWLPLVMNSGAWQRTITGDHLAALAKARHLADKDVLALQPEDLPECYPFILIPPYEAGKPRGSLQYWTRSAAGWAVQSRCVSNSSGSGGLP